MFRLLNTFSLTSYLEEIWKPQNDFEVKIYLPFWIKKEEKIKVEQLEGESILTEYGWRILYSCLLFNFSNSKFNSSWQLKSLLLHLTFHINCTSSSSQNYYIYDWSHITKIQVSGKEYIWRKTRNVTFISPPCLWFSCTPSPWNLTGSCSLSSSSPPGWRMPELSFHPHCRSGFPFSDAQPPYDDVCRVTFEICQYLSNDHFTVPKSSKPYN